MRVLISFASIAVVSALLITEHSYRASTAEAARLDADWSNLELPQSNGCFDDPVGEAAPVYLPNRVASGHDAVVARSRSISIAVAGIVSLCGCVLVYGFTQLVGFGFAISNTKSV